MRGGEIRFYRQRQIEMHRGLGAIAGFPEQCPEQIPGIGILWIEFQRIAISAFRGRRLAGLLFLITSLQQFVDNSALARRRAMCPGKNACQ